MKAAFPKAHGHVKEERSEHILLGRRKEEIAGGLPAMSAIDIYLLYYMQGRVIEACSECYISYLIQKGYN